MLKTRVIPCLLLKSKALVKTTKFKDPIYVGDPINTVRIFNEKEVDEIIILDITATNENKQPSFDLLEEIASECFMPLAYGGGINNIEDVKKIFSLGIEKIAINTHAINCLEFIHEISKIYGNQSIIASIDVKKNLFGKYKVFTNSGKKSAKYDLIDLIKKVEKYGAGEILITSMDQDGMMDGYDLNLIKQVSEATTLPVIACGGAGEVVHLEEAVKNAGASAVAAGSMVVYQSKRKGVLINFPDINELEKILD